MLGGVLFSRRLPTRPQPAERRLPKLEAKLAGQKTATNVDSTRQRTTTENKLQKYTEKYKETWHMVMREMAAGRKQSCWAWWVWPTPPAAADEGQWSTRSQEWQLHQSEARAMLADSFLCDCVVEIFDLVKRQLHNGADARALAGDDLPRLLASCRMWEWVVEHPERVVEHPGYDYAADRKRRKKWNQLLDACRGIRNRLKRRKRDAITSPHMPRAWELMAETVATRASPSKHLSQVGNQLLQQGDRLDGCVNYAQHTWASVIASLQTLGLHGDRAGPAAHWEPARNAEINNALDQESQLRPAHRYSNVVYYE